MKKLLSLGIAISLLGLVLEAILYGLSFNLITFIALILLLGFSLLKFSKREALLQKSIKISNLYSKGKFEARILQIQGDEDLCTLANNINNLADNLEAFMREISTAIRCSQEGKYYRLAFPQGLNPAFSNNIESINKALIKIEENAKNNL